MIRPGIRRLFRLDASGSPDRTAEIDEEVRLHLAARRDQLIRDGVPVDQADAMAHRQFGDLSRSRTRLAHAAATRDRRLRIGLLIDGITVDLRAAWRTTVRSPRASLMVIVLLALGIGANGALFGLVYRVVLRGPPLVVAPSELVRFYQTEHSQSAGDQTSPHMMLGTYDVLRERLRLAAPVAEYSEQPVTIGTPTDPRRADAVYVTSSYFPLLGVRPMRGRAFLPEEDHDGSPHVVILGWNLWQREFGGDSAIVGHDITFHRTPYHAIGIMPRGFNGTGFTPVDLWFPFGELGGSTRPHPWNARGPEIIARRTPSATLGAIGAEATRLYRNAYVGDPAGRSAPLFVAPINANTQGRESTEVSMLRWLVAVAAIVLVVACANAANLMLARAAQRREEMAVRISLGAGQWRVLRLLVIEGLLLASMAAAAAFGVARAGAAGLWLLFPGADPSVSGSNSTLFTVILTIAVVCGITISVVPALHPARENVAATLKMSQRGVARTRSRTSQVLTVTQVALSTMLLIAASLFVLSVRKIHAMDLGIHPERVLQLDVDPPMPPPGMSDADGVRAGMATLNAILREVRNLPGVAHASIAIGTPLGNYSWVGLQVAGKDSIPQTPGGGPFISGVSSDYFATVGTRILRGRAFDATDRAGSARVAIINERMARVIWPNADPMGACLILNGAPCAHVIGVAADVIRQEIHEAPSMHYYVPLARADGIGGADLLVLTHTKHPLSLLPDVRRAIGAVNPAQRFSIYDGTTMQDRLDQQTRPWRLAAAIFTILGALAFVVAAIGLYSVVSWQAIERTRELGIRAALGATGGQVMLLVIRPALLLALLGAVLGGMAAWAVADRITPVLFDTSPHNAFAFGVSIVVLLIAAIAAAMIPAWRATRVEPTEALRSE